MQEKQRNEAEALIARLLRELGAADLSAAEKIAGLQQEMRETKAALARSELKVGLVTAKHAFRWCPLFLLLVGGLIGWNRACIVLSGLQHTQYIVNLFEPSWKAGACGMYPGTRHASHSQHTNSSIYFCLVRHPLFQWTNQFTRTIPDVPCIHDATRRVLNDRAA